MDPISIARWHVSIATLLLLFIALGGPVAAGAPVATAGDECPHPGSTPVAEGATPAYETLATPETATPASATHGKSLVDSTDLIQALETCDLTVETVDAVHQPFLQPESGVVLQLSGGSLDQPAEIQVFEYPDAESVAADAAQIGPDGNPLTMMIHWLATPHFFQSGRLIVLYIGDDQTVVDLLTALLGPPFAGG